MRSPSPPSIPIRLTILPPHTNCKAERVDGARRWGDRDGRRFELGSEVLGLQGPQIKNAPASDMDAYIRRLEGERGKIEVFRRELPICARLIADVIDVLKEEAERKKNGRQEEDGAGGDKSEWMSTAQLWTGGSGRGAAEPEKRDKSCAVTLFEAVGSSGAPAFGRPCLRSGDKAADAGVAGLSLLPPPPVITSVPAAAGAADESRRQVVGFAEAAARAASVAAASGPAVGLQPQPQQRQTTAPQQARKSRRCWSPELHRQFVAALNQLGGPQVATPKQIREVMKVDGLTNDEVKSHLQKYRLHNRRAPGSAQPIVVVGGLWIPSPHQEQRQSSSQSGSPQGPLHLPTSSGVAVSAGCEEEGGCRSESYGWK